MTLPLLRVRNIEKSFDSHSGLRLWPGAGGRRRVLNGISFDLTAGRCLALVGESGSGKSTLARVIAGLISPDRGDVEFDGCLHSARRGRRARLHLHKMIQLIQQDARGALDPRMRIGDQICEAMVIHGIGPRALRRARCTALMARVGLDPALAARHPAALSGGQRQRALIARALSLSPRLLVCDEPTSALDIDNKRLFLDLVHSLQREGGLTVILVTHDLRVAVRLADHVAVLHDGAIVDFGPTLPLLRGSHHPCTRTLTDLWRPQARRGAPAAMELAR